MDSLQIAPLAVPRPVVAPARPRRIAVASGKGGVGKTWLAITLAHALARQGRRVLLFDGDLGLANIDIQLGLTPDTDLAAVIAGRAGLAQATLHFAAGGFDILPGRSGSGSLATLPPARLDWLMDRLDEQKQEIVLLDLGAGLDPATRRMAAWADTLLVVATDEPTSLTDAYAVLKLHAADRTARAVSADARPANARPADARPADARPADARPADARPADARPADARPADARIVVNQAASVASGQRTFATLAGACRQFLGHEPSLAGIIRRDEKVRDCIRRQLPLLTRHPTAAAAEDVTRLAEGL